MLRRHGVCVVGAVCGLGCVCVCGVIKDCAQPPGIRISTTVNDTELFFLLSMAAFDRSKKIYLCENS